MDFYFKYREYDRYLKSTFRHLGHSLNLYCVAVPHNTAVKWVLTKDRNVVYETFNFPDCEKKFFELIFINTELSPEIPELFNS